MQSISILIIEPVTSQLEILKKKLKTANYQNIYSVSNYQDALDYLDKNTPDIVLVNYKLDKRFKVKNLFQNKGKIQKIPLIIYSQLYDSSILKEVLDLKPVDFLPYNMNGFELEKAIELGLRKHDLQNEQDNKFKDYIFVRAGKDIKKLKIDDILYITVDSKYIEIHTADRRYFIRSTLTSFIEKLPDHFVRIHKTYAINMEHLDTINTEDNIVKVGNETLPLSRTLKKDLFALFYIS